MAIGRKDMITFRNFLSLAELQEYWQGQKIICVETLEYRDGPGSYYRLWFIE